jgi:hypothetical protein
MYHGATARNSAESMKIVGNDFNPAPHLPYSVSSAAIESDELDSSGAAWSNVVKQYDECDTLGCVVGPRSFNPSISHSGSGWSRTTTAHWHTALQAGGLTDAQLTQVLAGAEPNDSPCEEVK